MNTHPPISTINQLNTLLERHPYFRDRLSFPKHYWHAQCYLLLKHAQHTNTPYTTKSIDPAVIRYWHHNQHTPRLLYSLHTHEQARCQHEATLAPEHKHYRIDPSFIYESIRHLKDRPHTPKTLANAIKTIYLKVEFKRFLIADFKPYHESGPRWTRIIAKSIQKHKKEVENLLNQHISLDHLPHTRLRIGIHNHTLYLYHHRTNPDDWLTLLKQEYFYFDTTDTKCYLLDQARRHLNTTDLGLSSIIQQVTDHPGKPEHPKSRLGDLSRERPYLVGETLNFLLYASAQDFEQIQFFITRLGRDTHGFEIGGIHNPIFLKGEQRDLFKAKMAAIALSDGHIHHENKQFTYIEKDPERIEYVKTLIRNNIGDIHIAHEDRPSADRLNMPVVFGRLLEQWEIPAGDKHLKPNFRLPEFIRNGTNQIKTAYISEVIPEDGYFHTTPQVKFGIKRAKILDAGPKSNEYNFESKIQDSLKDFIREYGKYQNTTFRDELPREEHILVSGKLKGLQNNLKQEIRETAIQLQDIIQQNPCQLLEDEIQLCQSLGINMEVKFKEIHLHKSERISTIWEVTTQDERDTLRLAEIAMPASNPKRRKVQDWLDTLASH